MIVDVLSDSTETRDRGIKFQHYRTIDSLTEYLLIAQNSWRVDHFVRQPDDQWLLSEATTLVETITLPTIDCHLPLTEVYDKLDLDVATSNQNGQQL